MKKGMTVFVCLCFFVGVIGCEQFMGPQGPAGADGATGPEGPAGPGTTITELSYTVTATDEAGTLASDSYIIITDSFFEIGERYEAWVLCSATSPMTEFANTWVKLDSSAAVATYVDGSATVWDVISLLTEDAVITFYKFTPTE